MTPLLSIFFVTIGKHGKYSARNPEKTTSLLLFGFFEIAPHILALDLPAV
jgi:hypothetical protein